MSENLKVILVKAARIILLVVISIISIRATYGWSITRLDAVDAVLMTTGVEFGLLLFAWKTKNLSNWYFIIWIGFLIYSIIASRSFMLDKLLDAQKNEVHSSPEFVQYLSDKDKNKNQLDILQKRLDALNVSNSIQNNLSPINELNDRIAKKRTELRNTVKTPKTQRIRDDIQREIDSLERSKSELFNASAQVNKSQTDKQNEINTIYAQMAEIRKFDSDLNAGLKDNSNSAAPLSKKDETTYWTLFYIFLEFVRSLLMKDLSKTRICTGIFPTNNDPNKKRWTNKLRDWSNDKSKNIKSDATGPITASLSHTPPPKTPNKFKIKKKPIKKSAPVITLVPKANHIQQSQFIGFTNKDLEKYIDYMYKHTSTSKNGIESAGLTKMSQDSDLGLAYKTCRAIHGYLSTLGAIETKGKSTVILKSKDELLCTVKQAI